ncbi:MAG: protein-(glutamine-N5) methyltransferase, release factor-specific [Bacteroidetes bacterium GWE2_39_28]|nr:MAG: protein-(glutamine-N5) methyltransferase, release factor-specific [Bacteroidetes bacterium GWE2_39_28]OFY11872.1 MAG: protein-(glutamine-N5) methyltransferase, release factor-specific [Bacteroidetes bacterium GWF2_39_10]OFZ08644.1 MAG: protein-(glutamine-N5) methyltransferase, release factor-specific [Bacteroidetes bacterium RIFOXYB2_FULL_39_7]OFZ11359.1 MAG: protein-(glutamine-N5) methyltransferase, release factor-specific [Bacteroidetes bacterium RIFOXYC2_FULL_39_11]HCT95220.1 peptide
MVYKEFIELTKVRLSHLYPNEEGRAIAVRLLEHFCGINSYMPLVEPFGAIAPEHLLRLESALQQLAAARPLQYVVGFQEFCGLKIVVREGVLIPRPETEELVLAASQYLIDSGKQYASVNILDAACGSGCIAAALSARFPNANVYACDISSEALKVTTENLKPSSQHLILKYDLLKSPQEQSPDELTDKFVSMKGQFDLIVSNPPYVTESEQKMMRPNVTEYEPHMALFVPDHNPLLFYKALASLADNHLKPSGAIFMEINEQFGRQTSELFNGGNYSENEIIKDLFGKDRVVKAIKK